MKKILFTTLALLIGFSAALAQSCYFNGITLSSQEQVDNFPNLVPGCTVVEGNLTINGTSTDNITDLSPLSMIDSVKGAVIILNSDMLTNLDGLNNLKYIGIVLSINGCDNLTNLSGLSKLKYTGGLSIINNTQFTDFTGMDSLQSVLDIVALGNPAMTNLAGLENLTAMRKLRLENNPALNSLEGIQNVSNLEQLILKNNPALAHLQGLEQLVEVKGLEIRSNHALADISALSGLTSLGATFITDNNSLLSLTGLDNVSAISSFGSNASIQIARNPRLKDLSGLDNLQFVHFNLSIDELDSLTNLNALANLQGLGGTLRISYCNSLENLHGLEQLDSAFQLIIRANPLLTNIDGLMGLSYIDNVGNTIIENNPQLGVCNIEVLCNKLLINPNAIVLTGNAAGCNTLLELEQSCGADDVQALAMIDTNGNCEADENDVPAAGIRVHLESANRISLRDTEADGIAYFGNLDSSYLSFDLPQFPTADWVACQDTLWLNTNIPDTLIGPRRVAFLLQALGDCPKPTVELGLPPYFSDCSANADIQAVISNRGGSAAENVQVSVIIPDDVLEVISAVPQATSHLGDTMRFDIGNLGVFESSKINLTVKTRCNMLLPDQTICLAAKVTQENLCEENPGPHSEIAIEPYCLGDTLVRFTLKNVGNASTQAQHGYQLIENDIITADDYFELAAQESLNVDFPATGATYRLEATQLDNGKLTWSAVENCGGFTPGFGTAYWLDQNVENTDFDCRTVNLTNTSNQKTAVPTGVGDEHLMTANYPIDYTIAFQNTGADTAYRVQLLDVLSPYLDVSTFRPGYSSHPYTWEIRGADTLIVLFSPITLPNSDNTEVGSKGFFSYSIHQKPDLPDGAMIENTASIAFDEHSPIVTNTVQHTIGRLTVKVDELQRYSQLWKVLGNPANILAVFQAMEPAQGENSFYLYDINGRLVHSDRFFAQEYTLDCSFLPGGVYFFSIVDAKGREFTGKLIITLK